MKIIADENIPLVEEFFSHLGAVVRRPGRQMVPDDINDADALLIRSVTSVNADLLANSAVTFVGTCTIGIDHLDQDFLNRRGIHFSSAPGCNANSVVEYVYAALCELDVDWRAKTVGIIGCGNVGGLLHRRLRAQGVECRCYDPFLSVEQNPDLTSLEDVLNCDIVSLHTPLTKSGPYPSFHLLGLPELRQLKRDAVLLNCGRGPVIDNHALLAFLQERNDVRVVLDVWEPEPAISQELLAKVALGTPHIAGYSYDGKLKGTEMIYQALCAHLDRVPQQSLPLLVSPMKGNNLSIPSGDHWRVIKGLVKQVYDIAADDAALRGLANTSSDIPTLASGFDALRKHYPVRREFQNYRLPMSSLDPSLEIRLLELGFTPE
jgi:erythronate-4-phosphate dehydrogenase